MNIRFAKFSLDIGSSPHEIRAISRPVFARAIACISGFLAGLGVAQLQKPPRFNFERIADVAFSCAALISIFVVLHLVGQAAKEREEIAKTGMQAAFAALAGALLGSLIAPLLSFLVVIFLAASTIYLGVASFHYVPESKFPASTKLRTTSALAFVLVAQTLCIVALNIDSPSTRQLWKRVIGPLGIVDSKALKLPYRSEQMGAQPASFAYEAIE